MFNHYHDKSLWGFNGSNNKNSIFLHPGTLGTSRLWSAKNWRNLALLITAILRERERERENQRDHLDLIFSGSGDFDMTFFNQIATSYDFRD